MSRWRLAVSVVLVAAAVAVGGHFVAQALPLTGVAPKVAPALAGDVALPAPAPAASSVSEPPPGAPRTVASADVPTTVAQETPRQVSPSTMTPRVLQSFPPNLAPGNVEPGKDAVVTLAATVGMAGAVEGPVSIWADNGKAQVSGDAATADRMFDHAMLPAATGAQMRAAFDAVRLWRFEARTEPATVYIGFNFAADQSASFEPVRVGGGIKQPVKLKDVRPVYPEEAQNRGVQGVVILELLVDGTTGIPAQAIALRPVSMLTIAALQAALQWRFAPTPEIPRLQMTITVNFTLDGGVAGGVERGVQGGVAGGVGGGALGGVVGGTQLSIPAGWPAPIRVGGNIRQPTKIKDVRPVYPEVAQSARVQGVVIVEALIGPDGKIADARILRSIPLLDQAALDAVRQWEFTRTLLNGTPIPVIMTVTVNFTLEGPQPIEVAPEGTPPAGAAPVSQEGAPVYRPGPTVTIPRVLSEQRPAYEESALRDKVQGTAVVEAVVGPDGAVQDVNVVKGLDPRLDPKAIEAAYQWRFAPGTKNGVAVPVLVTMEMKFTLR